MSHVSTLIVSKILARHIVIVLGFFFLSLVGWGMQVFHQFPTMPLGFFKSSLLEFFKLLWIPYLNNYGNNFCYYFPQDRMAEGTKDVVTRQTTSSSWSKDHEALQYSRTQIQSLLMPAIALWGFHGGSDGEQSACNVGDLDSIPGSERFPGEGNGYLLQYSCLENPMDKEAQQSVTKVLAEVHGVAKSRTQLSN